MGADVIALPYAPRVDEGDVINLVEQPDGTWSAAPPRVRVTRSVDHGYEPINCRCVVDDRVDDVARYAYIATRGADAGRVFATPGASRVRVTL
jgi:hypothetical protein